MFELNPGEPQQRASSGLFYGPARDKLHNAEQLDSLAEERTKHALWRFECHNVCLHSSLENRTPGQGRCVLLQD